MGKDMEAIGDLDKLLAIDPKEKKAYHLKGTTLNTLGEYGRMAENYKTAIQELPDDLKAYQLRGNALAKTNKFDEALSM